MNEKERLRQEATECWDDEWFLKTIEDSEGDQQHRIHHTEERVTDGVVIRDIMHLDDDGNFRVNRWLINTTEYVAKVTDHE